MNNVFGEFFNQIGFETEEMSVEDIRKAEIDKEIEMFEKWLKLLKRNASEKEKYNFVTQYGFLSEKHFSIWATSYADAQDYQDQLEEDKLIFNLSKKEIQKREKELETKLEFSNYVRGQLGYQLLLRRNNIKDITPYGVDVEKIPLTDFRKERREVDIESYKRLFC